MGLLILSLTQSRPRSNTAYFTSYLTDAHAKLQKPIWLTEFMRTGTPDEQKTFLEFAVPWLEKQDFIERYAAFGAFTNSNSTLHWTS